MIIYVKNDLVSLRGSSYAEDENGNRVSEIRGKLFSPTRKKFVCDLNGNVLYVVRNKYWHFWTKKILIYDGQTKEKICKVKEKFFGRKFEIIESEDEYSMQSNGLFKGITILRNGEPIGKWWSGSNKLTNFIRDEYMVETDKPEEIYFLIALMIAKDNIDDAKDRDRD